MKISKIVKSMLFAFILAASTIFANVRLSQASSPASLWVNPPELTVQVGSTFSVDVVVNSSIPVSFFDLLIHFNSSVMKALGGGGGGGGAYPPFTMTYYHVDNTTGVVEVQGEYSSGIVGNNIGLIHWAFICTIWLRGDLDLTGSQIRNPGGIPIPVAVYPGTIFQRPWPPMYWKPSYPDYAPSGMPDFDEGQKPFKHGNGFTWCVPVAVADSLWWLDSEYESINFTNPVAPPTISDHFNLVTSYNSSNWDDHDPQNVIPLVQNLAFLMDTDGLSSGDGHVGTRLTDIQSGIQKYLQQQGVANLFEVHNSSFPTFTWIDNQTEKCQDVELCLEFWQFNGTGWIRPNLTEESLNATHGHCVTCAGSNSTTSQVAVCDPYQDAFEAGLAPGRSPMPHLIPHNSTIHNDAQYVSQDIYNVSLFNFTTQLPPGLNTPPPGYPSAVYELQGYMQTVPGTDKSYHAFIRLAVATSPVGIHDVAVTNLNSTKTVIGQGYPGNFTITVQNRGNFTETFHVTVYGNTTSIASKDVTLGTGNSKTITITWNTKGFAYGNYTISANVTLAAGETNSWVGPLTYGKVEVTIPGDVDGNHQVTILDVVHITSIYGVKQGSSKFNPNCDIDDDGKITILDVVACTSHYYQKWP